VSDGEGPTLYNTPLPDGRLESEVERDLESTGKKLKTSEEIVKFSEENEAIFSELRRRAQIRGAELGIDTPRVGRDGKLTEPTRRMVSTALVGRVSRHTVIDPVTDAVIVKKGETITPEQADSIYKSTITEFELTGKRGEAMQIILPFDNSEISASKLVTDSEQDEFNRVSGDLVRESAPALNTTPTSVEREAKIKNDLKGLWDEFGRSNSANTGINPQQIAIATKMLAKAAELGMVKFEQAIEYIRANIGSAEVDKRLGAFRVAYANLQGRQLFGGRVDTPKEKQSTFRFNSKEEIPESLSGFEAEEKVTTVKQGKEKVEKKEYIITIPKSKADELFPPRPRAEIEAEFREKFRTISRVGEVVPRSEGEKKTVGVVQKGLERLGKVVRDAGRASVKNKAMETASKVMSKAAKAIDFYLDRPIRTYVTNPAVKLSKGALNLIAKKSQKLENKGFKLLEDAFGESIVTNHTATSVIGDIIEGFFPNVIDSEGRQQSKRSFSGEKQMGIEMVGRLFAGFKTLSSYNEVSLHRVLAIFDMEAALNVNGAQIDRDIANVTYDTLTLDERQMYDYLRAANDYMHDLNYSLGLITQETYVKNKGKYIARLYEEMEATDYANSFGPYSEIMPGIYKKRKELYDSDSVVDPVYLTMKRLKQTLRNVAIKDYVDAIAAEPGSSVTKEEYEKLPSNERAKYAMLDSNSLLGYGELSNKYVLKTYALDLKGHNFLNPILQWLEWGLNTLDRTWLSQWAKEGLTTLNPGTRIANILGGYTLASWVGVDPVSFHKRSSDAKDEIGTMSEDVEFLYSKGIFGKSNINESLTIRRDEDALESLISDAEKKNGWKIVRLYKDQDKKMRSLRAAAKASYSKADDVAKLTAFKALVDQGLTRDDAALRVAQGFQNYESVGKVWGLCAKIPAVGPTFIRYQADLMRIAANGFNNKPATMMIWLAILNAIPAALSMASGEDDERRKIRENKPFKPSIPTPVGNIPLTWMVNGTEFNVARFMSPWYQYQMNPGGDDWQTKFMPLNIQMKDDKLKVVAGDARFGWMLQLIRNEDFRGQRIWNKEDSTLKRDRIKLEIGMYALRNGLGTMIPTRLIHDSYLSLTTGKDSFERDRNIIQTFVSRIIKIEDWEESEYKRTAKKYIESKMYEFDNVQAKLQKVTGDLEKEQMRINNEYESFEEQDRMYNIERAKAAKLTIPLAEEQARIEQEIINYKDNIPYTEDELAMFEEE
jgi:hypothetical protein